MTERRPWERLRSALRREGQARGPIALNGVTVEGFRAWAGSRGLSEQPSEEGLVSVEGEHRLGSVRAYCLIEGEAGAVLGVDVAVIAPHSGALPDLAALLLEPVSAALAEPERSAVDTWLRGQLGHRGPYNAATTLGGLQFGVAIDDANQRGRTWALTTRAA